ncbi:MAG: hypothetical protein A4E38_00039 [Methanoregulaceae archaeon PtaB.Bin108]|nr:MAG: hypothetical protein A4E38_00039 [Methanoregulaceae archaeon PtaB.Bin108]
MHTRTALLLILFLLIAGTTVVAPVSALKVDGARIALTVAPAQPVTSPIGISLAENEAEADFAIDVLGFGQSVADGSYTGLEASADTSPYSARSFIAIDMPIVHLKPGERADVKATISVPSGTRDGGRYAIILIHPATTASGAPAAFATAVAIPVLLTIQDGKIDEKGEITAVDISTVEIGKPFTVTATIWNSGNYHYYGIVSNVTISDSMGKNIASVKTSPMSRAIIPSQQVQIEAQVAQGLPEGTYTIQVRMETQDGDILDSETKSLQLGSPPTATPTATTATGFNFLPGPGPLAVCLAAAIGILGGSIIRQKGKK